MKGINRDVRPAKLNDEYLNWAKNIVLTENLQSVTNEKGSILHTTLSDNILGIIPVNEKAIVFTIDNKIGVLSETNYTVVSDPNNVFNDLNFNAQYPIVGEYQFNNKEECIIAFTDNFNKPKVANIGLLDNPTLIRTDDIKDILMFPEGTPALFDINILNNGGSLSSGSYNISYAYRNQDVTTNYFQLSAPISITDDPDSDPLYDGVLLNIPTSKAIEINFTDLDTSYETLVIGIIYRTGTGILANEYFEYTITGSTLTAVITQLTDNILLPEEVTVPKVNYRTVKTLSRLNDRLYAANLTTENDIDYQAQANNIKLNWYVDRTIDITESTEKAAQSNGKNVGYIAGEVYAFYIRLWFDDGSYSRAFHIPGRDVEAGDLTTTTIGDYDIESYKFEDTVNKNGLSNMGYWINENELYPTNFPTLGGENVRHHRFPSLNWLHTNEYRGSNLFGVTFLPVLGVSASNVIDLPDNCTHWELLYARRTYTNSTHAVQALGIHSAFPKESTFAAVDTNRIWTSGGNWNVNVSTAGSENGRFVVNRLGIDTFKYMRLNSPDIHQGKPIIPLGNVLIKPEYKLTTTVSINKDDIDDIQRNLMLSDTLDDTVTDSSVVPTSTVPKIMTNREYLLSNSLGVNPEYYNVRGEYTLQIESDEDLNFGDASIGDAETITVDGANPATLTEKMYLVSLVRFPSDCYNAFYLQDTVQTGKLIKSTETTGTFLSGDGFIVDYSYISYAKNFPNETTQFGDAFAGIRAIHRYMLQTPFNFNLRYISNQPYTDYYPKVAFPDIFGDGTEYPNDIEPNQIAFNREYSFNEVNKASAIYNPDDEILTKYPLRIIRSEIFNPESTQNNWKQYLPNDYYEQKERSRGEIINVQGYNNNLIIHQERGMFLTTERTQLDTSQQSITLGSGDIFDVIPQELIPSSTGYAGTQHQLGCNMSKVGYAFIDSIQGKVFLYNDKLNEISNTGLRNFFQENLVQRETIIEQTTRSIPKTYNSVLNRTTIPKFQLEYAVEGVIYYDIIPPSGWTSDDDYYYTIGNDGGGTNVTLPVLKRYNTEVYQDNPYLGNGYSITYDEEYSRLLLLKTKDCNENVLTQQATLTRTRYLNTATREISVSVTDGVSANGSEGVQEFSYSLNPNENVVFVDFRAQEIPDKIELIHNGKVVAYSSMQNRTPATDGGYYPYPDRNTGVNPDTSKRFPYRSTPAYPTDAPNPDYAPMDITGLTGNDLVYNSANSVIYDHTFSGGAWGEWFIGTQRTDGTNPPNFAGGIPNRLTEFEEATGIVFPMTNTPALAQQRIWFTYSDEDYAIDSNIIVRVTGVGAITAWNFTKYSGVKGGLEWYDGTEWINSYVQWVTDEEVTALELPDADTIVSTAQYEYFNGTTYIPYIPADLEDPFADAPTYTQWFNGVDYQDTFTTFLDCGAAFILEGRIKGYNEAVNASVGDIVIVETSTDVYEYKEFNGSTNVNPTTRDEFLLSYSPANNMWISNHSPKVNYLFSTYNKYHSLSNNEIYLMNVGDRTTYFVNGTSMKHSAFIDVIFNTQQKTLFSSFMWNTEVFDENGSHYYDETIDKIRIYSNTQTTDTISLTPIKNTRRVYNKWSFNEVRDNNRYNKRFNRFVLDNLELIESEIRNKLAHRRGRFITDWVVARLEITSNKQVIIHTVEPVIKQAFR